MRKAVLLALFVTLLAWRPLCAQSPKLIQFSLEDGLPSTEVYDLLEDHQGYLWIATDHGLCRYDGYTFRIFTTEDGLTDNTVFDLLEDEAGRIWTTTYAGGISYCVNERCYPHPSNAKIIELLGTNYPDGISFLSDGTMRLTSSLSRVLEPRVIEVDTKGNVRLVQNCLRLEKQPGFGPNREHAIATIDSIKSGILQPEYQRNYIRVGPNEHLLTSYRSVIRWSEESQIFDRADLDHQILSFYQDREENVWVGHLVGKGISFLPKGRLSEASTESFLKGRTIADIHQDREGNLWFCTLEDGLYMMPSLVFKTYGKEDGVADPKITSLGKNLDNRVYCSSYGGQYFFVDADQPLELIGKPRTNVPAYDAVTHPDGTLFFTSGNIFENGTLRRLGPRERASNSKSVLCLRNGDILFGRPLGISIFRNKIYQSMLPIPRDLFKYITALHEEPDGSIWMGTLSGTFVYQKDTLIDMATFDERYRIRASDFVRHPEGHLFIATKGLGLLIRKGEELHQLTVEDGLNGNMLRTVFLENDSTLWLGSNLGLNRVIFSTDSLFHPLRIEGYRTSDGLPSDEINHVLKANNLIWLATSKGLTYFDPQDLKPYAIPPRVHITQAFIKGEVWDTTSTRQLNYDQNDLSFQFLGISVRDADRNRYRYRLQGYDDQWIETSTREANFTNLPSGDYTFAVTACNNKGYWQPVHQTLQFSIAAHFTDLWWFRLGVSLLVAFCIYLLIRALLARQRTRETLDRRIIESEQKALRAQINPHFIFNAMNSIQYFISGNDKKRASIYLSRFSMLMRKILEDSRKNLIALEEELDNLRHYLQLEHLRFPDKFTYQIKVDPELDPFEVELPPMIIQPFLENAIWHGLMPKTEPGQLWLIFRKTDTGMCCEVIDNGIGRVASQQSKKDKRHRSTGIQNTQERIQVINSMFKSHMTLEIDDPTDANGNSLGTRIKIDIPRFR